MASSLENGSNGAQHDGIFGTREMVYIDNRFILLKWIFVHSIPARLWETKFIY